MNILQEAIEILTKKNKTRKDWQLFFGMLFIITSALTVFAGFLLPAIAKTVAGIALALGVLDFVLLVTDKRWRNEDRYGNPPPGEEPWE